MNQKKAYVSPQVIRVKLEPTQAVLSQCEVGAGGLADTNTSASGDCRGQDACKQSNKHGNSAANS